MNARSVESVIAHRCKWHVEHADNIEVLRALPDACCDSLVTDPPSGVSFMGAEWDGDKGGRAQWVAWLAGVLRECLRVLKPGAFGLVWALPRTSHWTATACEDAGFTVRDVLTHLQGQGFPKSESCLKPSAEHWILIKAPGPLEPLQIDACRLTSGTPGRPGNKGDQKPGHFLQSGGYRGNDPSEYTRRVDAGEIAGRWPPNAVVSHTESCAPVEGKRGVWRCDAECPVRLLHAQNAVAPRFFPVFKYVPKVSRGDRERGCKSLPKRFLATMNDGIGEREHNPDEVSAYTANHHPTVKASELMRWLCKLVTAPKGIVLDPFAGSGTTGVAALTEGFRFLGIEREGAYVEIGRARVLDASMRAMEAAR